MINAACFHGKHFSCSEGIQNIIRSHCLCNYLERNEYPDRVIKGQKKINIWYYEPRGKSYPNMKVIHMVLTDSLRSIIGVNGHCKHVICFSKTFLDS